jgi:hypothetical protein
MIRVLIRKELRQLVPIAILIFVIISSDLIYHAIDGRVDEASWAEISGYLTPGEDTGANVFYLILCLITAFSLFPREYEEGSIEFLYSLPVGRISIFAAKLAAAFFILEGGIFLGLFLDWALQLPNHQSLTGDQFRFSIGANAAFLMSVFTFTALAHGILISFFRRFGIILYGIWWWIVWTLEKISPSFETLNFMNLFATQYHGQDLLIPWRLVITHTCISWGCILLAAFLWITPAERYSTWYRRLPQKRWGRVVLICSTVVIIAVIFSIFYRVFEDPEYSAPLTEHFAPFESSRFSTEHYQFTYPGNLRDSSLLLIKDADSAYGTIRNMLAAGITGPVIVDLTEESDEHAGIAGWNKIRMDIRRNSNQQDHLRILHHETVHVFEAHESNRKISDYKNSTAFFCEGLAEYLSFRAVRDDRKLSAQRLLAATSWLRHKISFDELIDKSSFKARHNENLFYALGETWAMALAKGCGDAALGNVLRAMGREDAPKDLSGLALWQDTLQAIDCDLEKVNAYWVQYLSDISEDRKDEIELIPRLSGGVAGDKDGEVVLIAYTDRLIAETASLFMVRVRNNATADEEMVRHFYGIIQPDTKPLEIMFTFPTGIFIGRRFEYQFGYVIDQGIQPYFEPWQSGAVP